jgi:hypothetical protein
MSNKNHQDLKEGFNPPICALKKCDTPENTSPSPQVRAVRRQASFLYQIGDYHFISEKINSTEPDYAVLSTKS